MSSYATIRPVRIGGQALLVAFEFLYPPPLPSTEPLPQPPIPSSFSFNYLGFSYWMFQLCQEGEGKLCSQVSVLSVRVEAMWGKER